MPNNEHSKVGPSVTEFADFVFRESTETQKRIGYGKKEDWQKYNGIISESNMSQYKAAASQITQKSSEWKIMYRGAASDSDKQILECRFLTKENKPLRGCPDLVIESIDEKSIIIVEQKLKTDYLDFPKIPDHTWPNVRAQLWAYSWITDWDHLPDNNVIMIAEYFWRPNPNAGDPVYLGCRGVWKRSDQEFNRESMDYFERFGGKIDSRLKYQIFECNGGMADTNSY